MEYKTAVVMETDEFNFMHLPYDEPNLNRIVFELLLLSMELVVLLISIFIGVILKMNLQVIWSYIIINNHKSDKEKTIIDKKN